MSETKHTPSPWSWQKEEDGSMSLEPGVLITDYTDGTPWGDEIDKANARLIAAAPDLLEALKEAVLSVRSANAFIDWDDDNSLEKWDAIISKAEGRS